MSTTLRAHPYEAPSALRPSPRVVATALNCGLALGSLLGSFLLTEVAFGLAPGTTERVLTFSDRRMTVSLDCYPTNPRGYFDLDLRDPALRGRFESLRVRRTEECAARAPHAVELRYNSLQFRDREPGPRRPGVRRVIVLGDSFTEGQGVKESDVYPRALERLLRARGGEGWEVLNFGHRGADFPLLYENFERLLELDPDVVVYGMMLNDCEQAPAFRARHPLLSDRLTGRSRQEHPASRRSFGLRTASFVHRRLDRLWVHGETTRWYHELYSEPNRDGWGRTQEHIREMHRRMRERGGHLLLATWPVLSDLESDYPFREVHETVGRFCYAAGIPWIDLLPALEGRSAATLWVHPLDAHPNQIAHGVVADRLAPVVVGLVRSGPS